MCWIREFCQHLLPILFSSIVLTHSYSLMCRIRELCQHYYLFCLAALCWQAAIAWCAGLGRCQHLLPTLFSRIVLTNRYSFMCRIGSLVTINYLFCLAALCWQAAIAWCAGLGSFVSTNYLFCLAALCWQAAIAWCAGLGSFVSINSRR